MLICVFASLGRLEQQSSLDLWRRDPPPHQMTRFFSRRGKAETQRDQYEGMGKEESISYAGCAFITPEVATLLPGGPPHATRLAPATKKNGQPDPTALEPVELQYDAGDVRTSYSRPLTHQSLAVEKRFSHDGSSYVGAAKPAQFLTPPRLLLGGCAN